MQNIFVVLRDYKNSMKNFSLFILLLLGFNAFAQEDAWVYFTEKPGAQAFFDNPELTLSTRALERRSNQGIALDLYDVPISQSYIDAIAATPSISVMAKSKWLNALHIRGTQAAIGNLTTLPFVASVDFANHSLNTNANKMGKPKERHKIKSANRVQKARANFPYGASANQIEMLNGQFLHQQDFTGRGKIIAVLDGGFPGVDVAQPFQRLRDNGQILGGYNFVDRNTDFYSRGTHGTLVLSTMGGYTSNQLVGTAPDASYYLFITEDTSSETPLEESNWAEAAEMADSLGADVLNTSLGYFLFDNPDYNYTYADLDGNTSFISRASDIAFSRGMIVVNSAGNSGASANPYITMPADAVNVLTVGAVDSEGGFVSFSSVGPTVDGRIKPDVMAKGLQATVSNEEGTITVASGTSFSGPIMAGMVASLWQAIPWATNEQVMDFIKQSGDTFAAPTDERGYGIPDFQLALSRAQLALPNRSTDDFLVYPNPVENTLFVSLTGKASNAEITFYNSLGQKVACQKLADDKTNVTLDNLVAGIYYYKIISSGAMQSGKVIKN